MQKDFRFIVIFRYFFCEKRDFSGAKPGRHVILISKLKLLNSTENVFISLFAQVNY